MIIASRGRHEEHHTKNSIEPCTAEKATSTTTDENNEAAASRPQGPSMMMFWEMARQARGATLTDPYSIKYPASQQIRLQHKTNTAMLMICDAPSVRVPPEEDEVDDPETEASIDNELSQCLSSILVQRGPLSIEDLTAAFLVDYLVLDMQNMITDNIATMIEKKEARMIGQLLSSCSCAPMNKINIVAHKSL